MMIVLFHQHNPFTTTTAAWLMGRGFDVPVFFILAGFFIKDERLVHPKAFILGKLRALYFPATIISVICILLHNIFIDIGWYSLDMTHYYSLNYTLRRVIRTLCCLDSGETLMGAMWFLYTLLYDFIILSLLAWGLKKLFKREGVWQKTVAFILLICMSISCYLTQNCNITISRISVVLSSMFLIWVGRIIYQQFQLTFDNNWALGIAVMIFVEEVIMVQIHPRFALNEYQSVIQLLATSCSFIYIGGYVGKRIARSYIGHTLTILGRESFYIMALHIVGLFCCNSMLEWLDVYHVGDHRGIYTYLILDCSKTMLYLIFGCIVPFAIMAPVNLCINYVRKRKSNKDNNIN